MKVMTIMELILAERDRQLEKWGVQRHTWGNWMLILGEEFGESCQALLGVEFPTAPDQGAPLSTAMQNARMELIQVAAVCTAIIEHLDEQLPIAQKAEWME